MKVQLGSEQNAKYIFKKMNSRVFMKQTDVVYPRKCHV